MHRRDAEVAEVDIALPQRPLRLCGDTYSYNWSIERRGECSVVLG